MRRLHKPRVPETAEQKDLLPTWECVDGLGQKCAELTLMNGKVVADVAGAEQEDLGYHEGSDVSLVVLD